MGPTRDGPDQPADEELVKAVARGSRTAFDALYARYERPLYRYIRSLARTSDSTEEILNDVMLEVWRGAARYAGRSRVSTWIFGIAHHKTIDRLRRRRPDSVELDSIATRSREPDATGDAVAAEAFVRAVALALEELPAEQRAVVELAFGMGYGYRDIAEIVQCPVNTVKTRVFHARRALQTILERRGARSEER